MLNLYFVDTSSDFKAHGLLGPSKTTEELRKSIDICSAQLIRERQLNTELRSSNDALSQQLTTEKQLNERLDRENKQWKGDVDKLKKELFGAQQVAKQSMEIQKDHKLNYEAKLTEIKRLEDKNRMLQNELKRLEDENRMLENELEQRNEGNPF